MFKISKKLSLCIAIVFLIIFTVLFFYLYQKINNNKKIYDEVNSNWQTELNRRNDLKSLNNLIKIIEPDRVSLEQHFIQSSDVVPFLDNLESLGSKVGVKVTIGAIYLSKDNSSLSIESSMSGSFTALYEFLKLLENSSYEVRIDSFNVVRSASQSNSGSKNLVPSWDGNFKISLLSFIP